MNISEDMYDQGYVVIPQIIDKNEISLIRENYISISRQSGLATLLPCDILKHPQIFAVLLKEKVIMAIRQLFGRNFSLFPDFTIRESVYIPWHNDAYFLPPEVIDPLAPLQFMQCAIYLQDNDPELGGGITLIPCSHRLGKSTVSSMLALPEVYEKMVMSKAGDLILWDSRMTHRSSGPDQAPDRTQLALQWSVSASEKYAAAYLSYLRSRSQQSVHVGDFLPESAMPYFADMVNVVFPDSFHPESLRQMAQQHIQFTGL
ncbi:phytanoyl-CoA dioxygenase family protein [Enterobacteriaceae bacterium LUAb1]